MYQIGFRENWSVQDNIIKLKQIIYSGKYENKLMIYIDIVKAF